MSINTKFCELMTDPCPQCVKEAEAESAVIAARWEERLIAEVKELRKEVKGLRGDINGATKGQRNRR